MVRGVTRCSWSFVATMVCLFAGSASAGGSQARPAPVAFAGNPPMLVAELRQGVVAGLRDQFIAAAKSEPREVAGRMEQPKSEWELAARMESE